jgi:hypothetical protein
MSVQSEREFSKKCKKYQYSESEFSKKYQCSKSDFSKNQYGKGEFSKKCHCGKIEFGKSSSKKNQYPGPNGAFLIFELALTERALTVLHISY